MSSEIVCDEALVSSIIQDAPAAAAIIPTLNPAEFFTPSLQAIVRAMQEMQAQSTPIDWVSVSHAIGGTVDVKYLREIIKEASPSPAHLALYLRKHREHVARRDLISKIDDFRTLLDTQNTGIDGMLETFKTVLGTLDTSGALSSGSVTLSAALDSLEAQQSQGIDTSIPCQFPTLVSRMEGGLHFGEYAILAGPPSMGKSTLALQLANRASETFPVLYFSFESPATEVAKTLVAQLDRPYDDAVAFLRDRNFVIVSAPKDGMGFIGATCAEFVKEHGQSLIIIDTINRIYEASRPFETRHRELSYISNRLDGIAEATNSAVLAIAQLNRAFTKNMERPPRIQDLRDCGELEEHADVILLLYSKNYDNKNISIDDEVTLTLGKQRNRATGVVFLAFDKAGRRFYEIEPKKDERKHHATSYKDD
jgi:replicative DNA helicase